MDYIGKYVAKYESGNKGSLSLGTSGYDWGISCGTWQLTLRYGNCIKFLKKYFPKESTALYFNENTDDVKAKEWPGRHYSSSPEEVKEIWYKCYEKVGGDKFLSYEHEFIKNQYYDKVKKKIIEYIDLDKTSRAFQEMFWSWSVNAGVAGAYNGLLKAMKKLNNKVNSYEKLLDACYDVRFEDKGTNRYKKGLNTSERETLRKLLFDKGIGVDSIKSPLLESQKEKKKVNYKAIIYGGSVYVRKGPGKHYDAKKIFREGQKVRIIAEQNNFGYAFLHGWVSLNYVEKI